MVNNQSANPWPFSANDAATKDKVGLYNPGIRYYVKCPIAFSNKPEHPQNSQIASAKVLTVGAGGIGCELLKTLVLSGFKNIHVVRDPSMTFPTHPPTNSHIHSLHILRLT
jgi:hypothetical protein